MSVHMRVGWDRLIALLWLVSLTVLAPFALGDSDAYSDQVARTRVLGYHGFLLLSAALCVSPLSRWLRESAKLRRALGLAAAASALLHGVTAMASSPLTLAAQLDDPQLRFGAGAFSILLVLALTSFPRVVSWLRLRSWKELHRLAYPAWICALLHGLLAPYAWLRLLLAVAGVVIVIGVLRLVPRRTPSTSTRVS